MTNIPLALELYSLRDDLPKDVPGVLADVAKIGYQAVEFAGYHGYNAKDLREILDDLGLKCAGTHTGLDTISDENINATAEFMATLGSPFLIVPGVGAEYRGTRDGALRLAEKLSQASKTAAEFGARVGYHNHEWEFESLPGGSNAMEILATNTPPEVVLQVDTGNLQEAGVDPIDFLQTWTKRLGTVHLKPYVKNRDADFARYFIGDDDSDWNAILSAINPANTEFVIVEQERYPNGLTPLECVKRCYDNLQKLGA